jgi:hypothetical protein
MPYKLQRSGRGYYVVNKDTGRKHSNRPLTQSRARAQMRALYAAESGYVLRSRAGRKSPFAVRAAKKRSKARSKAQSLTGGATDNTLIGGGLTGALIGGALLGGASAQVQQHYKGLEGGVIKGLWA